MKYLLPMLLFLGFSSAQASHHFVCDINAKIIQITKFDLLNGTTAHRFDFTPAMNETVDNRPTVLTIKVTKILNEARHGCGLIEGMETQLSVKTDELNEYGLGQQLKLTYINRGDALGSETTWTIQ